MIPVIASIPCARTFHRFGKRVICFIQINNDQLGLELLGKPVDSRAELCIDLLLKKQKWNTLVDILPRRGLILVKCDDKHRLEARRTGRSRCGSERL